MAIPINKLAGMSPELETRLHEEGILDSDQLLDAARTPSGQLKHFIVYFNIQIVRFLLGND